jgi:hypothetical protein
MPATPHALVAVGASGIPASPPGPALRALLPQGWSAISGEAAFLAASRRLRDPPARPDALAAALSGWTVQRIDELSSTLATHAA